MADTLIMDKYTVASSEWFWNEQFGAWTAVTPRVCELVPGEYYAITNIANVSEVEFRYEASEACDVSSLIGMQMIAVGNLWSLGLPANGSMYIIGDGGTYNMFVYTGGSIDFQPPDHTFKVHHDTKEEPEEPEIIDIVLFDRNGEPVVYNDIETITVDTTVEGNQQVFTRGVAVDGLEIVPDFSGGDMPVNAMAGTLVRSATIRKPETLDPEIIAYGEYIAGIGPGTYVTKGSEKTAELDFGDYEKIDNTEAMAAILTNVNNLGKVFRYVGESGDYTNGQFYKVVNGYEQFDPKDCSEVAVEVTSGTDLTATINCNVGDLIVAAFAIRSGLISLSDGWTLISTSKDVQEINSTVTVNQTLSFAFKYAEATTESITVTQETAGRIYMNLVSFGSATGFSDMGYQYQNCATAPSTKYATFTRPDSNIILWGATCNGWSSNNVWTLSNESKTIQSSTTAPRLLLAIDTSDDETVTFTTNCPMTANTYICGALSIEFPPCAFKPVDDSEAPLKDSIIVEPDPGTLLSKVILKKPETLIPKNIANGVDIAGIIGSGNAKFGIFRTPSGAKAGIRINADIGFVPDFLFVKAVSGNLSSRGRAYMGFRGAFSEANGLEKFNYIMFSQTGASYYSTAGIETTSTTYPIHKADATGFNLGCYAPMDSSDYFYVAIGALT